VVISYDPHDLFADPNLMQVLHGVDAKVTERDHVLLLSSARSADDQLSAYRRLLGGYRVDGVLIESGRGEEGVSMLIEQGYPCVIIGHSALGLPCVHPDDERGAQQMAAHLLALGHRRIGLITGPPESLATKARLRGFQDVLTEAGCPVESERIVCGNYSAGSGYEGIARLMDIGCFDPQGLQPTAIFAFNDRMAFGAIHWLRERGYRVPEDVSVGGFDDIESAAQFNPPLTTVRLPANEIGRRAAAMLFDMIEDEEQEGQQIVLPTALIVRHSTSRRKEATGN
jgi:DNA-binding LacI/PurR family transcriptional regulator